MNSLSVKDKELNILCFLYNNQHILKEFHKKLKYYSFQYPNAKLIFNQISYGLEKYNQVPTSVEIYNRLKDYADKTSLTLIEQIQIERDLDYIADPNRITGMTGETVRDFIIQHEIKEISEDLAKVNPNNLSNDLTSVKNKIERLGGLSISREELGLSAFSEEGIDKSLNILHEIYTSKTYPTGFDRLDEKLHGGLRPQELAMILAPTGRGKTTVLINMAANQVKLGRRVVYIAMDNPVSEITERLYACISDTEIVRNNRIAKEEWKHRIKMQLNGFNNRFIIKDYPSQSKNVIDIINYIKRLRDYLYELDIKDGVPESEAGRIDVIYQDYLEKLKASEKTDLYRIDLERNCDYLLQLAQINDCAVVTASQANRKGMEAEDVELQHGQESIAKFNPVSICLGISQTREERLSNPPRFRLNTAGKFRRATGSFSIPMIMNVNKQQIREDIERDILMDDYMEDTASRRETLNQQSANQVAKLITSYIPNKVNLDLTKLVQDC
jgi:replicative DNA helicase